ncbi:MAG: hypothetical protein GY765_39905, partial [bacterium]|nr:hypothetical protein [bacterium]
KKILVKIDDRYLSLAVGKSAYKISWEFNGGEISWSKLSKAFSENRSEADFEYPEDRTLQEMFGGNKPDGGA